MRCKLALAVTTMVLVALAGCQKEETEAEKLARKAEADADTVRMAEAAYEIAVFDTITWESEEARLERGGVVYRSSCEKCHGQGGGGNGEVALEFQIPVPSFVAPDWPHAGDLEAIRRGTFVGHMGESFEGYTGQMPNWGLVSGMRTKDIDAVAAFIADRFGPEPSQE
jgi:mono/diheme cytochrome c family protein